MDLLSHVAYSHGILAMSQRSVSQFQVCQQWHSTSSRLLRLRRTLNTFSASVVMSLLARETALRHHWSAECFEVELEVSIWTAVTVNWQTSTDCAEMTRLTVLSHYAELNLHVIDTIICALLNKQLNIRLSLNMIWSLVDKMETETKLKFKSKTWNCNWNWIILDNWNKIETYQ